LTLTSNAPSRAPAMPGLPARGSTRTSTVTPVVEGSITHGTHGAQILRAV
jgi:hypothetical protein